MNSIKIFPIVIVLFFSACSQLPSNRSIDHREISFHAYIKSLDTIPLPFKHACSGPGFPEISLYFDSAGFKKYKEADCARPLGVLFNDGLNIVTVDLSNADFCIDPFLVSFDRQGNKVDSLNLYKNTFADTDATSMPYFSVNKDKSIVIVDTAKQWKLDQSGKMIPGSETTSIDSTTYFLSKNGKFSKGTRKKF